MSVSIESPGASIARRYRRPAHSAPKTALTTRGLLSLVRLLGIYSSGPCTWRFTCTEVGPNQYLSSIVEEDHEAI
jgi:hypothetical protein